MTIHFNIIITTHQVIHQEYVYGGYTILKIKLDPMKPNPDRVSISEMSITLNCMNVNL